MGRGSQKYRDTSSERTAGRDDSSSSDASESLIGHDGEKQHWRADARLRNSVRDASDGAIRPRSLWQDMCHAFGRCRWLIDLVLLLFIIGMLLEREAKTYGYCEFEGTGDITGFAPKISQQIKTFVPDFSFAPENVSEFFSAAVQNKWLSMVPRGLGYVKVDNPEQYNNLPTPLLSYPNATVFTSSVTHQLHCLHSIVGAFAQLQTDPSNAPDDMTWHLNHCFEYLRQNILCCGDTALEGEATTFPDDQTGSDGWDAKHVCKNYKQIYDYLDDKRADDDLWI